ncbi:hypothetical protein WDW86_11110 [Bdellovibrionota bacterium FG-2]
MKVLNAGLRVCGLVILVCVCTTSSFAMGKSKADANKVDRVNIPYLTSDDVIFTREYQSGVESYTFNGHGTPQYSAGEKFIGNGGIAGTKPQDNMVFLSLNVTDTNELAKFDPETLRLMEQLDDCILIGAAARSGGTMFYLKLALKAGEPALVTDIKNGMMKLTITRKHNPIESLSCSVM